MGQTGQAEQTGQNKAKSNKFFFKAIVYIRANRERQDKKEHTGQMDTRYKRINAGLNWDRMGQNTTK